MSLAAGAAPPGVDDTIAALSSPPGASERAVVRVTGPRALDAARAVVVVAGATPSVDALGDGRGRSDARLILPGWPPVDVVAVVLRAPRTVTGDDVVELWVPGSPPLVRALLEALMRAGARAAAPGELTRRAFLRGRLDLTRAEAVLALTSAEERGAARAALRALEGGLARAVDAAKAGLLDVLAHVEAAIDFSEEELDHAPARELARRLDAVDAGLAGLVRRGRRRPAGATPTVVLAGPPNAGKSALLNALAGRPVAIVADVAGTTRDPVEARWRVGGLEVRLVDTAGADDTGEDGPTSEVEAQAQARAAAAVASADLVLLLGPDEAALRALRSRAEALGGPWLLVASKADLHAGPVEPGPTPAAPPESGRAIAVSSVTGAGLAELAGAVRRALDGDLGGGAAVDLCATARQEALVDRARAAVSRARAQLLGPDPARAELAAVDLADAIGALGALTGAVTTDDLLDRLFGQFCVGK